MPRKAAPPTRIGLPDPLQAAREEARHAKEGAYKLQQAVDALRTGLQTIAVAEYDHERKMPVGAAELRAMACATLDEYSRLCGQSWRTNPLIGSYVGDRSAGAAGDFT